MGKDDFVSLKPGGELIIGQDQDTIGGFFDSNQAFSGELTQVGLWSRILSNEEIDSLANCSSNMQVIGKYLYCTYSSRSTINKNYSIRYVMRIIPRCSRMAK